MDFDVMTLTDVIPEITVQLKECTNCEAWTVSKNNIYNHLKMLLKYSFVFLLHI